MTAPVDDSAHPQMTLPAAATTRLAVVLVGSLLVLGLTALSPAIELDSWLALVAWAVSASGGWLGVPVVLALGVGWIATTGTFSRSRSAVAVLLLFGLGMALVSSARCNEHLLKPTIGVPRPNFHELARRGVIPSASDLYQVGDKQQRTEELRNRFTTESSARLLPRLHPLIREHWLVHTGYAFPSGHALASFTLATAFTLIGLRLGGRPTWVTWTFLPWAILVGWSRHLLRVHSTADISAGGLIGIVLGLLIAHALTGWINRQPA